MGLLQRQWAKIWKETDVVMDELGTRATLALATNTSAKAAEK